MAINKFIIVGHMGRDPELRYMPNGDAACSASVGTTEKWTDKASGEKKEATEWHRVVIYGRLAEIVAEYAKKGTKIYFEGKIKTRKYQDKATGEDKYTTELNANVFELCGGGGENQGQRQAPAQQSRPAQRPAAAAPAQSQLDNDDIPF